MPSATSPTRERLIALSGEKTGRSPKDKRVVEHPDSKDDVWWGSVNVPIDEGTFETNLERAIDYLNSRKRLYVVDAFAGWDPKYRAKGARDLHAAVSRAVHAQHAHPPDARRIAGFRRAGRGDLQRGRVSGQSPHQGNDLEDERSICRWSARSSSSSGPNTPAK